MCLAADATTLAILRGEQLMFYRHRTAVDEEPLSALVHQTAMYHEDRLGGDEVCARLAGGAALAGGHAPQARREIADRLSVPAEAVDVRPAAGLRESGPAAPDISTRWRRPSASCCANGGRHEDGPMLRGNLSTRPFYNERLVTVAIALIALGALALTAFNVSELVTLSKRRSDLTAKIARDAAEPRAFRARRETLRRTVDANTLRTLAGSTREANYLIDQRAFSWTVFFGLIEKTTADGRPARRGVAQDREGRRHRHDDRRRQIGQRGLDVQRCAPVHGTFYDVLPSAFQQNDDGTLSATIVSASYNPPTSVPKPPKPAWKGAAMKIWRRVYQERRKVALPLLVFLIANAAVLAFAVLPLKRSVAVNETETLDATAKLGQARLENKRAAAARLRKEEADQELKKFYADVLPADRASSVRLVLFWVERAAREARVDFRSSQADQQEVQDSRLQRIGCHLTLRGDYQDIRRFLYNLETAQQFIIVEKVELAQQGTAQTNANGMLEVGLDVATYFLGGER